MIALNALTAADKVIIPVQAHFLPVKGLEQLLKTVNKVKRQLNPKLQIGGILLTMVESRSIYAFDGKGKTAKAYEKFTKEVLENEKQCQKDTAHQL